LSEQITAVGYLFSVVLGFFSWERKR